MRGRLRELFSVPDSPIHGHLLSAATGLNATTLRHHLGAGRHFCNRLLVPKMLSVVLVVDLLGYDGLAIEQAFRKSVVLSLNTLGLLLADDQVQAGGLVDTTL